MNTPAPAWMRWTFVPLGFLSNLCAGTVYAWSVFRKPVESELGISAGASGWPFVLLLAGFSITMFFTGAVIARIGPRATALAGAALTSGSYLLSAHASSLLGLVVAYGLIGGLGVGLSYAVPLAVITRWFDRDRGLALGCALIGFGLSPLVTAPLARHLIAEGGPERAFTVLGWLFLAVMGICALAMRFPAAEGARADAASAPARATLARSPKFWALWLVYFCATFCGLMAIGITSPVAQEIIRMDAAKAAGAVAIFALFNGAGRPLFGWLSDRFPAHKVTAASFLPALAASLLMASAAEGQLVRFFISFACLWMLLGAWLAMAPNLTSRFFGAAGYARNYGRVYTAYGAGALLGTLISGQLRDLLATYHAAFYPAAALAALGCVVSFLFLRDSQQRPSKSQRA